MRRIIEANGGPTEVAKQLGYSNGSYLVQMTGPNPSRTISERNARTYEEKLGLPKYRLDEATTLTQDQQSKTAKYPRSRSQSSSVSFSAEQVTEIVMAVNTACEVEGLNISLAKFSQLIALALTDAVSHGGNVREGHIKSLVQLTK